MERDRAIEQLAEYWALVGAYYEQPRLSTERRDTLKAINSRVVTVNQILNDLAPDMGRITAHRIGEHDDALPLIGRAVGLLGCWQVLAAAERSDGPVFPLEALEAMVREAALPLWRAGKYRQGVRDAANSG